MAFIPKSYLDGLQLIPKDLPVAIVMRHAERFEIKQGEAGFDVPLTEDGKKSAFKLGKEHFIGKKLTVFSSSVGRCIDTGENILKGAQIDDKVVESSVLAGDKIFINDFIKMATFYMTNGMLALLDLVYDGKEVEGVNNVNTAVYQFLDYVLEKTDKSKDISLFVTHDMFISLIVGELFRHKTTSENWPEFMEPIFIWKDGDNIKIFFRNQMKDIPLSCIVK